VFLFIGVKLGTIFLGKLRRYLSHTHSSQTDKIGMQGKRQRLFISQKYPISSKSQKEIPIKCVSSQF
jgi:hypothetical protein